jgi:hypothetical protein
MRATTTGEIFRRTCDDRYSKAAGVPVSDTRCSRNGRPCSGRALSHHQGAGRLRPPPARGHDAMGGTGEAHEWRDPGGGTERQRLIERGLGLGLLRLGRAQVIHGQGVVQTRESRADLLRLIADGFDRARRRVCMSDEACADTTEEGETSQESQYDRLAAESELPGWRRHAGSVRFHRQGASQSRQFGGPVLRSFLIRNMQASLHVGRSRAAVTFLPAPGMVRLRWARQSRSRTACLHTCSVGAGAIAMVD